MDSQIAKKIFSNSIKLTKPYLNKRINVHHQCLCTAYYELVDTSNSMRTESEKEKLNLGVK